MPLSCILNEKFLRFHLQDKHNASFNMYELAEANPTAKIEKRKKLCGKKIHFSKKIEFTIIEFL